MSKIQNKFKIYRESQGTTPGQKFGEPKLTKNGKEFNVRDWIQSGREDTEIYPTLEKYGSIEKCLMDHEGTFGDFTEIKDLRNIIDQTEQAENLWKSLPREVRQEFNHDKREFMEKGENWLKTKIEESKQTEVTQGTTMETNTNE